MDSFFELVKLINAGYDVGAETLLLMVNESSARQMEQNPYRLGIAHTLLSIFIFAQFFFFYGKAKKALTDFIYPIKIPALQPVPKEVPSGLIRLRNFLIALLLYIPYLLFWVYLAVDIFQSLLQI